jgi:hypothetical protein
LNNGAGTSTSNEVNVRTLDGGNIFSFRIFSLWFRCVKLRTFLLAPEGFDRPDVKTINSTSVELTWSPPRIPNGQITTYHVYA